MKQRELTLLKNPELKYLPPYILKDTESFFARYEKMAPEKREQMMAGYRMLQEFVRKFAAAGGKIHSGSDPNHVVPGYAVHAELQMLVEAGLSRRRRFKRRASTSRRRGAKKRITAASRRVKWRTFSSLTAIRRKIFRTRKTSSRFSCEGKKMDTSFHADYKNPIPRPIEDRPEQ